MNKQLIAFLQRLYERERSEHQGSERQSSDELMEGLDGERLWHEIMHSYVAPQVYHLVRERGLLDVIPASLRERLKTMADAALVNNLFIRGEMNKLFRAFEEAGIEAIPLKGIRFSERFFGHFAARGTSDIDLLIKPSELAGASEVLERLGFLQGEAVDATHFHVEFTKKYASESFPFLSVELHWNVLRSHISGTRMEQLWDSAQPYASSAVIQELSVEQTFYHICLHGYNHQLLSFKYILDVVHLLYGHAKEIQLGKLLAQAENDRNLAKMLIVLTHAYDLFPALHAIKPLPASKRWPFWSLRLMDIGPIKDKNLRYYLFRVFAPFVTFDTWQQQFADFRYSWFPPRDFALAMVKIEAESPFYKVYGRLYWNRLQQIWRSHLTKAKG